MRNVLIQLSEEKEREKTIIDILDLKKDFGFKIKEYIILLIEQDNNIEKVNKLKRKLEKKTEKKLEKKLEKISSTNSEVNDGEIRF